MSLKIPKEYKRYLFLLLFLKIHNFYLIITKLGQSKVPMSILFILSVVMIGKNCGFLNKSIFLGKSKLAWTCLYIVYQTWLHPLCPHKALRFTGWMNNSFTKKEIINIPHFSMLFWLNQNLKYLKIYTKNR